MFALTETVDPPRSDDFASDSKRRNRLRPAPLAHLNSRNWDRSGRGEALFRMGRNEPVARIQMRFVVRRKN